MCLKEFVPSLSRSHVKNLFANIYIKFFIKTNSKYFFFVGELKLEL